MPVILVHQGPTLTQERYEAAVRKVSGKDRLQTPADWSVPGLLVHAAGEGGDGFRVVDLWESADAAARFGALIGPILHEVGVTDLPEVYPAHTFVSA